MRVLIDRHVRDDHHPPLSRISVRVVVCLAIAHEVGEPIHSRPRQPLGVVEIEDVRDGLQLVLCASSMTARASSGLSFGTVPLRSSTQILMTSTPRAACSRTAARASLRSARRRPTVSSRHSPGGIRWRDAAAGHPEQRAAERAGALIGANGVGDRPGVGTERQHGRDAGDGIAIQLIDDVLARVALGGETVVPRWNPRWIWPLTIAGITVLPVRSTRAALAGALTEPRSPAAVTRPFCTHQDAAFDRRPAGVHDHAGISKTVTVGRLAERTPSPVRRRKKRFMRSTATLS